jgi:hypothetical protein
MPSYQWEKNEDFEDRWMTELLFLFIFPLVPFSALLPV